MNTSRGFLKEQAKGYGRISLLLTFCHILEMLAPFDNVSVQRQSSTNFGDNDDDSIYEEAFYVVT